MNNVFQNFLRKFDLVLFDDILIYSQYIEDHLLHLRNMFASMKDHHLLSKESKCFFGVDWIEYTGHFITREGVSTDLAKTLAIQNWPIPTTIKQLRGFIGLTGYYRRFIQGFGIISNPLTDLLKTDSFKRSPAITGTFEQLKEVLTRTPVLALLDANKTFVV